MIVNCLWLSHLYVAPLFPRLFSVRVVAVQNVAKEMFAKCGGTIVVGF